MSTRPKNSEALATVLRFDENLGRGLLRLSETGETLGFTYKQVSEEGFIALFEGERVRVNFDGRGRMTLERLNDDG